MNVIRDPSLPSNVIDGAQTSTDFVINVLERMLIKNGFTRRNIDLLLLGLRSWKRKSEVAKVERYNGLHDLQILLGWDSGVLPYRLPCKLATKPSYIFQDCLGDERICVSSHLPRRQEINYDLTGNKQTLLTMIFVSTMFFHIGNQPPWNHYQNNHNYRTSC